MKTCGICGVRKCASKGKGKLRKICTACRRKPWTRHKKDKCEFCGFIPAHNCQLDVDHVDGNKDNNDLSNLMTLCANCHRLKTYMKGDHLTSAYPPK